jgi:hypothetical protein
LLYIALCFATPIVSFAQTDSLDESDTLEAPEEVIINGKHYKAVEENKKIAPKNSAKISTHDSILVVNNNKFQYVNNWFCFGGGVQQNLTYKRTLGFVGGADLNFHIKRNYFQVGAMITGRSFANYNNYQIHFGYAKRFEDRDYHFAAAAGFSYSAGYQTIQIDSVTSTYRGYDRAGVYIQGEVIKKITYDVGLGACLFADWNKEQSMIGLKFTMYFSGAYTGKKQKQYEDY